MPRFTDNTHSSEQKTKNNNPDKGNKEFAELVKHHLKKMKKLENKFIEEVESEEVRQQYDYDDELSCTLF